LDAETGSMATASTTNNFNWLRSASLGRGACGTDIGAGQRRPDGRVLGVRRQAFYFLLDRPGGIDAIIDPLDRTLAPWSR
jgi:hypothetical protein